MGEINFGGEIGQSLERLTKRQRRIYSESEHRSSSCADAYVIGNEIPDDLQQVVSEAYRKGWYRGGIDNVKMIEQYYDKIEWIIRAVVFGCGILIGAGIGFFVFG